VVGRDAALGGRDFAIDLEVLSAVGRKAAFARLVESLRARQVGSVWMVAVRLPTCGSQPLVRGRGGSLEIT
jgi:hypothetical protein